MSNKDPEDAQRPRAFYDINSDCRGIFKLNSFLIRFCTRIYQFQRLSANISRDIRANYI